MKNKKSFLFTIVCTITLITASALAGEAYTFTHRGIEQLGKGDAGVASVNNQDALFYNPAALDVVPRNQRNVSIINTSVEVGENVNEIREYWDRIRSLDEDATNAEILSVLNELANFDMTARVSNLMHFFNKYGGFGLLTQASGTVKTWNDGGQVKMGLKNAADLGLVFGHSTASHSTVVNHNFLDINFGYSAKYVQRYAVVDRESNGGWLVSSVEDYFDSNLDTRYKMDTAARVGMDVGMIARFRNMNQTSFGIHIRDAITTQLPTHFGKIRPDLRIGVSTHPRYRAMGVDDLMINFDIDKIFDSMPFRRRIHFGLESKGNHWTTWRMGFNGIVPTFGASVKAGSSLLLSYASHGEELTGPNGENMRYRNHMITFDFKF